MSDSLRDALLSLLAQAAIVLGLLAGASSCWHFYRHADDPSGGHVRTALGRFLVGILALGFNNTWARLSATFSVQRVGIERAVGTTDATAAAALTRIEAVVCVIGVYFFIRGLTTLYSAADADSPHQARGMTKRGVVMLVAGVLFANPGWLASLFL